MQNAAGLQQHATIDPLQLPPRWQLIRLKARSKQATERGRFTPIKSHRLAQRYLDRGANLGLLAGPAPNIAIIDIDQPARYAAMCEKLGPLPIRFVESGGGDDRGHYYIPWQAHLPRILTWEGERVGEIISSGYVVIPPSIHPDTGRPYRWCVDPATTPILALPARWQVYLDSLDGPAIHSATTTITSTTTSTTARRQAIALAQPGANRRGDGKIKFQCPACTDSHRDNAVLFPDGRYGCAQDDPEKTHKAALRRLLGASGRLRGWIDRLVSQLTRHPLPGRTGSTDTAVLLAHVAIARRLDAWEYRASEREIAEAAGIKQPTVHVSHQRLVQLGRLDRLTAATSTHSTVWLFIPGYPAKVSSGDQSSPEGGYEETDPRRKPFFPLDHDVFRNQTGLGKGCGLTYQRLLTAPEDGLGLTQFGSSKAATWKRLKTLQYYRLARYDRSTRRWFLGSASLDRVVRRLRSDGTGAKQRLYHQRERLLWQHPDRIRAFPRGRAARARANSRMFPDSRNRSTSAEPDVKVIP